MARRVEADPMRVSGVRSPEGPLFYPSTRPDFGDATVEAHISTRAIAALHPAAGSHPSANADGTCSALRGRRVGVVLDGSLSFILLRALSHAWKQCW
jgi:hypothetical protein